MRFAANHDDLCVFRVLLVLSGVIGCYRVLSGVIGCYRVLSGVIGCYRVLSGVIGCSPGNPGHSRSVLSSRRALSPPAAGGI